MADPKAGITRQGRFRRLVLGLFVFSIAGALALLVGEVAVRVIAPQELILRRPDLWYGVDGVGWVKRGSVATRINTGEKEVHLYTDPVGYRVGANGAKPGPPTIILLGDSFMEALQVEHEESLAGLLESELSTVVGGATAVRNTAVSGWGPDQYLLQLRQSLAREPANVVLTAVFVGNDVINKRVPWLPARTPVEVHHFRFPRGLSWSAFIDAVLYPLNDFLEVRSQLFVLAKRQSGTLRMKLGLSPDELPRIYLRDEPPGHGFDVTAAVCDSIAAAGKAAGAETIFLLLPESFQVEPTDAARFAKGSGVGANALDLDRPNRLMTEALSAKGLTVVDAMPALRAAVTSGSRLFGTADRHLSPEGHRIVSDLIKPLILERLRPKAASGT